MYSRLQRFKFLPLCAAALLSGAVAAQAQSTEPSSTTTPNTASSSYSRSDGYSILPWTRRGYVGINVGRSDYGDLSCGTGLFDCDDRATHVHLYTGGLFNEWIGLEVGYLNQGSVDRAGGSTRSQGANLSLVARAPLGAFNLFGKVGTTYGRTRVSSELLSGVDSGSRSGWVRSYGFGAGVDLTPRSGVVLEWARHGFRQPGGGERDVDSASLGYVHRF